MSVQRLKFAQARGARIEFKSATRPGWFEVPTDLIRELATCPFDLRIHPDDAHLEYGPISSALREAAITGKVVPMFHAAMSVLNSMFPETIHGWWDLSGEDRLLQWLMLAEPLADEGL